eukprot:Em0020g476a
MFRRPREGAHLANKALATAQTRVKFSLLQSSVSPLPLWEDVMMASSEHLESLALGLLDSVTWAAAVADTSASNKVIGFSSKVIDTSHDAVLPKTQLGSLHQDAPNPIMAGDHIPTILAGNCMVAKAKPPLNGNLKNWGIHVKPQAIRGHNGKPGGSVSTAKGTQIHPSSSHFGSFSMCFRTSADAAADPPVNPASAITLELSGEITGTIEIPSGLLPSDLATPEGSKRAATRAEDPHLTPASVKVVGLSSEVIVRSKAAAADPLATPASVKVVSLSGGLAGVQDSMDSKNSKMCPFQATTSMQSGTHQLQDGISYWSSKNFKVWLVGHFHLLGKVCQDSVREQFTFGRVDPETKSRTQLLNKSNNPSYYRLSTRKNSVI